MRDFNRTGGNNRFASKSFGNRSSSYGNNSRPSDRSNRFDRPRLEMFSAVCDECGKDCEVPFKPSGNKEVFCKECFDLRGGNEGSQNRFDNNRSGDRSNFNSDRRDSRDSRERVEFVAKCDECGNTCTLPFRPTSNKPVYCSECFAQRGERDGAQGSVSHESKKKTPNLKVEIEELKDQITSINVKLEKIMTALNIKPDKVREPKSIKVSQADFDAAVSNVDEVAEEVDTTTETEITPKKELVKTQKKLKPVVESKPKAKAKAKTEVKTKATTKKTKPEVKKATKSTK